jgi:hypothetical protein
LRGCGDTPFSIETLAKSKNSDFMDILLGGGIPPVGA